MNIEEEAREEDTHCVESLTFCFPTLYFDLIFYNWDASILDPAMRMIVSLLHLLIFLLLNMNINIFENIKLWFPFESLSRDEV